MSNHARTPLSRTVLGLTAAVVLVAASATAQEKQELVRYQRVGPQGTRAFNLPDAQAVDVLTVPADTVLAVHGERDGWLDVEVPGGFKVWVWGEYLAPTDEAGVLRVTGSDVRMRPLPSSGVESYALLQKLGRGEKLRLIARHDEALPMAQDWVQVWSPPGARAWVRADETVALEPGASGAALWGKAVSETLAARKPVPVVQPASAPKDAATAAAAPGAAAAGGASTAGAGGDAAAALRRADALFASEKAKEDGGAIPDYAAVIAAYEGVRALGPQGVTAERLDARLAEANLKAETYAMRIHLENEIATRKQASAAALERIKSATPDDPLAGRFEARGWLEQRLDPGRTEPVWVLRWSGDETAELVCFSGRYDLAVFAGFQLGISGRRLSGPVEASAGVAPRGPRFDVESIVVLSGRGSRR